MRPDRRPNVDTDTLRPAHTPWSSPALRRAEELYHAHGARVYSLALRLLGSEADAAEVAVEVLLRALREPGVPENALAGWLRRLTVQAVQAWRAGSARRAACLADTVAEGLPAARGLPALLEGALLALPEEYRDAYVLCDVEGLSVAEAAALLGLRPDALGGRLHRARLLLRDALSPYLREG